MNRTHYYIFIVLMVFIAPALVYAAEQGNLTDEDKAIIAPGDLKGQGYSVIAEAEKHVSPVETVSEQVAAESEIINGDGIMDPLEPINRMIFSVNDRFYFWIAKPIASGYSSIVPEWGRVRIRHVFHNMTMPVRFVNNILQLKIRGAGVELLRFIFNTTAGVAGMFDVAKNIDLVVPEEDTGQTLGVYGIGNGFYVVLPLMGPSSLRDTVGKVGDYFLTPVSYIGDTGLKIGVRSLDYTNETSLHIGDYEDLKEAALDPYISFRNAYYQYRIKKIRE